MRSSSQRKLQKALETAKEQRQTLRANKTHEGQHDIDNNETTTIPSSPKRSSTTAPSTHQPWPGYVSVGKKTAGANDAGPYGGIYAKANSKGEIIFDRKGERVETAMIKRDTVLDKKGDVEEVRVGKIIGEFVAGRMLAGMMQALHDKDDKQYAQKYVAHVELVSAKPDNQQTKEGKTEAALTYLKSIFLKNYTNDFWKEAFICHYGNTFNDQYHDNYAEALKRDNLEDSSQNINMLARRAAKDKVEEKHDGKPKQVRQALLKQYDDETIMRPKEMLEANPTLMTDFCEQVAARLLLSDYGIHTGNFGVIDDGSGTLRMGSIDFGAAFCNLLPDVEPFARFGTGTKPYKNHLLEYHPDIIKSEKMAQAFIGVGSISDTQMDAIIDNALEALQESDTYKNAASLKKFCSRMGMPKDRFPYKEENDITRIYFHMKNFMRERMAARCESLLHKGYGLLLEHCMDGNNFNLGKVKQLLMQYPDLGKFIASVEYKNYKNVLPSKNMNTKIRRSLQKAIEGGLSRDLEMPKEIYKELKEQTDAFAREILKLNNEFKGAPSASIADRYNTMQTWVGFEYPALIRNLDAASESVQSAEDIHYITTMRQALDIAFDMNTELGEKIKKYQAKPTVPAKPPAPPPRNLSDTLGSLCDVLSSINDSLGQVERKLTAPAPPPRITTSNAGTFKKKSSDPKQSPDDAQEHEHKGPKYGTKHTSHK